MSILNDAKYSSRMNNSSDTNTTINTTTTTAIATATTSATATNSNLSLASKLLSRKRKRHSDDKTPDNGPRPNVVPQRSASEKENLLDSQERKASLSLPLPLPSPSNHSKTPTQVFFVKSINNDKPQSYRILSSIPRASLPLTFVDNSTTPTRLFSARLPQLDTDAQTPPHVLIVCEESQLERDANADADGALYAVERVGNNTYGLCKLAEWLKLHHIQTITQPLPADSTPTPTPVVLQKQPSIQDDGKSPSWWKVAAVHSPPPVSAMPSRKAPRLSLYRPEPQPVEPETVPVPVKEPLLEAETTITSAEDVFVKFISQYLDTLYLSKTPLGFFTKGPLSRARAAFTSGQIEGSSLVDLVQFLRTMVHSSSATDNKYRDKLPDVLKDLPPREADADKSPAVKKKRRKKRLKPDKNGMLPEEVDYFAKWWYQDQDDSSAPSDETAEQCLRRRSTQLRTRETFMQVILVLEVLSLESLPEFKDKSQAEDNNNNNNNNNNNEGEPQKPKAKGKKAEQLTVSLELLVDKLCIWHSLDGGHLLEPKPDSKDKAKEGANQLRSFCVEVIIPFYMSRIPEHVSLVNKKLGGPSTSTSSTSSKSKSSSTRKPGEPDTRKVDDKKSRRSLHRVATEVPPQPARVSRTLERSATDSQMLSSVKRETPEVSLDSIPLRRDSQPAALRRSDSLSKHRLRQREVDFGAIAAANDARAKRRQEVEQKLKDAISTLKKPSRATVSGEFADVLEQRKRMAQARARPSQPKRTHSSAAVAQVAATPKHVKNAAPIAATPHHIPQPSFVKPAFPSSGPSLVPSSNIKAKSLSFAAFPLHEEDSDDDQAVPATDHRPRHRNALAETPSKPRVGFAPLPAGLPHGYGEEREVSAWRVGEGRGDESPLRESPSLLRTPSKPSRPWIDETPSKPVSVLGLGKAGKAKGKDVLGLEKSKGKEVADVVATATPVKAMLKGRSEEVEGQGQGSNIYDALGWNDEFED